jgi:hypothetical protein
MLCPDLCLGMHTVPTALWRSPCRGCRGPQIKWFIPNHPHREQTWRTGWSYRRQGLPLQKEWILHGSRKHTGESCPAYSEPKAVCLKLFKCLFLQQWDQSKTRQPAAQFPFSMSVFLTHAQELGLHIWTPLSFVWLVQVRVSKLGKAQVGKGLPRLPQNSCRTTQASTLFIRYMLISYSLCASMGVKQQWSMVWIIYIAKLDIKLCHSI